MPPRGGVATPQIHVLTLDETAAERRTSLAGSHQASKTFGKLALDAPHLRGV
jgi:hypothetical protein